MKRSARRRAHPGRDRDRRAATTAGWLQGTSVECVAASDRYLLGEETALLEVVDGRPPFPRVAPPYRAGVDAGHPVSLVNNVETLANVPAHRPRRARGLPVVGHRGVARHDGLHGQRLHRPRRRRRVRARHPAARGARAPRRRLDESDVVAVLSGTAHPFLPADRPRYPALLGGHGGGRRRPGFGGFIVIDGQVDLVAVAHGVSRFLSVESCGQCTPCKEDGLAITGLLDRLRSLGARPEDEARPALDHAGRITDGARCYLAQQHQNVVQSLLQRFPTRWRPTLEGRAAAAEPFPIVPLDDIVDDEAVLALDELDLAPDWGDGSTPSPSDRIDVRAPLTRALPSAA